MYASDHGPAMITATIPVQMATIGTEARTRQQHTMMKGPLARVVRILIAVGLTAFLLWQSDPSAVLNAARGADLRFILLACVLVFVDRALMAYRWLRLLSPLDPALRPPFLVVMRVFFVSTFLGTFLPASIGGDAVRAYGLSREGVGGADAVASVLMDRLLGVVSILLVASAGSMLARDLVDVRVLLPAFGLLGVACVLALAVVFSSRAALLIGWALARLPRGQTRRASARRGDPEVRRVSRRSRQRPGCAPLRCRCCGCCRRTISALRSVSRCRIGIYFALVPLILLIVLMPITINGIGTAQAGFVWLFGRAGVASAPAFALSVLFLAIAVVGNLPGGVLYLIGEVKGKRKKGKGDRVERTSYRAAAAAATLARCLRFSADARTRNFT